MEQNISCGAILLHMTSNFAPHDKIVCNVEQFVMLQLFNITHCSEFVDLRALLLVDLGQNR